MMDDFKRNCKICPITTLGQDEYIDCLEELKENIKPTTHSVSKIILEADDYIENYNKE